ncbi:hypothetical protein Syun_014591 [Stephania yunnanensis]|uniref:Uncharacterized protein n=1 Tax=Stephania yunnanensis TaxID=152371 RepID=A0AAP0JJM4_9MAGN
MGVSSPFRLCSPIVYSLDLNSLSLVSSALTLSFLTPLSVLYFLSLFSTISLACLPK